MAGRRTLCRTRKGATSRRIVNSCQILSIFVLKSVGRYHLGILRIDAENLKRLREDRALSLRELAEASGVSHTTIWDHERGKEGAHPRTIRLLAEALGVAPKELMKGG